MTNWIKMNHLKMTVAGLGMLMLTACNGIFDDIYDEPEEIVPAKGQIVMNATSWTDWYYIDLPHLQKLTEAGDEAALLKAQTEFEAYPIPMTATVMFIAGVAEGYIRLSILYVFQITYESNEISESNEKNIVYRQNVCGR